MRLFPHSLFPAMEKAQSVPDEPEINLRWKLGRCRRLVLVRSCRGCVLQAHRRELQRGSMRMRIGSNWSDFRARWGAGKGGECGGVHIAVWCLDRRHGLGKFEKTHPGHRALRRKSCGVINLLHGLRHCPVFRVCKFSRRKREQDEEKRLEDITAAEHRMHRHQRLGSKRLLFRTKFPDLHLLNRTATLVAFGRKDPNHWPGTG